ncbi:sensor histidine kinase [Paenibacillus fonticola]|uniref:sensor histidine kinase n=1 Tax=Paenibacillus fonticola TaxID=379896 RepID=UPI00037DD94C|nr:HAMP domain-containing sensor histidine kinase [Paenibacillus fonticola]
MKTLYRQFTLITVLIMLFSTVVSFFLTNTYYLLATKELSDRENIQIAQQITQYIESTPNVDLDHYLKTLGQVGYQLYVTSDSGYSRFIGSEFKVKTLPEAVKSSVFSGKIYNGMESFPNQTFMSGRFANELQNTVGVPFRYQGEHYGLFLRPHIDILVDELHIIFAIIIISMALISLLAMLVTAKQIIRPIAQLTEATKQISLEKYDHLLTVNRKDEIGQLAESFNQMTKQLQVNDQSRKEFISNVSHDFQSPLLNIQGYADLLKSQSTTEEERVTFTSIIEAEAKRLSILTKQLLLLTSLDQSNYILERSFFSLDQQLKSMSQKYLWRIEEMGIELYYKTTPVYFYGDKSLLETVWDNLLTNALKYNKPHGSIQIEMKDSDHSVTIQFKDTGIGIQESELNHLFERFYREDSSRSKEGTGLGLTIVKQIVELHGGSIHVSSKIGEGTCFTITLPKKNSRLSNQ